jgi:hypothetical protein
VFGGAVGPAILVRKTLGSSGELRVHNIPVRRYRLSVTANGKPIRVKEARRAAGGTGLAQAETVGATALLFVPESADARMVTPQTGSWKWIEVTLETP